jgi:hypothetical protein
MSTTKVKRPVSMPGSISSIDTSAAGLTNGRRRASRMRRDASEWSSSTTATEALANSPAAFWAGS